MTFDEIKYIDDSGAEFWYARELQQVLEYTKWDNFHKVIKQAQISCRISQQAVNDHFVEVGKMVEMPLGARANKDSITGFPEVGKTRSGKIIIDYKLTRYACYLIVMNGDPRKEVIALGQTYFAVKTRQQELRELYNTLTENERRLFLRSDIKQKNMLLAEAAQRAGIQTQLEFAVFQDNGYMGLYGGETARIIAARKGVPDSDNILDYMGSEELGANLFRITQADAKIKRENISTPAEANKAHYEVGVKVRKAIKDIGGIMPEELPTPEISIKEIEKQEAKRIKAKDKRGD